jgi:hypothetical protein
MRRSNAMGLLITSYDGSKRRLAPKSSQCGAAAVGADGGHDPEESAHLLSKTSCQAQDIYRH